MHLFTMLGMLQPQLEKIKIFPTVVNEDVLDIRVWNDTQDIHARILLDTETTLHKLIQQLLEVADERTDTDTGKDN